MSYCPPYITGEIKWKRIRWMEYVARIIEKLHAGVFLHAWRVPWPGCEENDTAYAQYIYIYIYIYIYAVY
jgi:hypothetical protein